MRRIGLVMTAALVFGLAGACSQGNEASAMHKRLSVVEVDSKATTFEQVDLGKPGFGPGDQLIEESPVQNAKGTAIGKSADVIHVTSGKSFEDSSGFFECTINLARGTILINGWVTVKDLEAGAIVPVVGGTGAYAGATGTAKFREPTEKQTYVTMDLTLPKAS